MHYLYLLAFGLALISCCSAQDLGYPNGKYYGQPGCQTEEEISVKYYRNFYIKNQYWVCHTQGVPAATAYCPNGTGFLDTVKACVPWSEWYYTPTELPPSQPKY